MSNALFHRLAAEQGWTEAQQIELLLEFIGHQGSAVQFAQFLQQAPEGQDRPATDPAVAFLRAVAAELGDPGLATRRAFQIYCLKSRAVMTAKQAAVRWCRWHVA
jgi:hypothetical protein